MSGIFSLALVLFGVFSGERECPYLPDYSITWCVFFGQFLVLIFPIFIFSFLFVVFKTNDDIFINWKRFTWLYVLVYFLIYVFSPNDHPGLILFYKETVAIGAVIFYSVASLIYVAYLKFRKV